MSKISGATHHVKVFMYPESLLEKHPPTQKHMHTHRYKHIFLSQVEEMHFWGGEG